MSKIDRLIREFCPDGVEHKPMGEIGTFTRGRRFVKDDIRDAGAPCIHYGEMYTHYGVWAHEARSFLDRELAAKLRVARSGDVVIVAAGETIEDIGIGVAWLGKEDVVIHDACYIFSHSLEPKFVSYFLRTKAFHSQITRYISSGKISSISAKGLEKAKIPIPPLEVQKEIVSILDKFTQLDVDLSSELKMRRKQYDYYRHRLLDIDPSVPLISVGEICTVFNGYAFKSAQFNTLGKGVPLIRIRDVNTGLSGTYYSGAYDNKYVVHDKDILIGMDGDFRAIRWENGGALLNQRVCRLQDFVSDIDPGYIFYIVRDAILKIQASTQASTVRHLSSGQIGNIKIPLLPLDKQKEISSALDKFDLLVNSTSEGIPAEIDARRRQHEYYRTKLFTFQESTV